MNRFFYITGIGSDLTCMNSGYILMIFYRMFFQPAMGRDGVQGSVMKL